MTDYHIILRVRSGLYGKILDYMTHYVLVSTAYLMPCVQVGFLISGVSNRN